MEPSREVIPFKRTTSKTEPRRVSVCVVFPFLPGAAHARPVWNSLNNATYVFTLLGKCFGFWFCSYVAGAATTTICCNHTKGCEDVAYPIHRF